MKKRIILSLLALMIVLSMTTKQAKAGLFYTEVIMPVSGTCIDGHEKVGTATSTTVLNLVSTGDAGIKAATQDAEIKQIHYIDQEITSIFIFFTKRTTRVYGY